MTGARVVASLILLATFGCAAGPRYHAPEPSLPARFSEAPFLSSAIAAGPSLERWWAEFHDPVLDGLVHRAVEGNLDLRIAAARVREVRAARRMVAAADKPQVGVRAGYGRTRRSDAVPPFESASGQASPFGSRVQDTFEAGFDASWEIDLFGGVRRDEEAARAQVDAAQEAQRDVLVTVLAEVARVYLELCGTQRRQQILEGTLRSQRDTLDLVIARRNAGLATELDVSRATGLLAGTAALRPMLEREARQSVHRLGVLLGKDPGALLGELQGPAPPTEAPGEVPGVLPSELLARRPDLRRAERELAAATARVGVARADLFPRIALLGTFQRKSDEVSELRSGRSQLWSFVPAVRWPLFSSGRIRANVRVQDARREQALFQLERAVLVALEEVENALSAHEREARRQEALREEVSAEATGLGLARERYRSGLENFLAVLDAQRSLYAAQDRLAESETRALVSLVAVYKSLGGGWS